ncbi:MBL fold metallo-hydrolase, partial [Patescibacteria group bacterium]|nr:MBL fold metallo-hydrolase [Patescibacteria group bacterium]
MRKKFFATLATSLVLIVGLYFYVQVSEAESKVFKVTFLNVGQGDSALIRFSDGEKMLVDCGVNSKILEKLGEHLPFYDRVIDYLLITHPDSDHYGGCVDVLKRYDVKQVITNSDTKKGDSFWAVWEKYLEEENAVHKIISKPQVWEIDGAKIEFLSPDKSLGLESKYEKGNNNSIVFRLVHGSESFLFMGDAELPVEMALINKYCASSTVEASCPQIDADYLKVGHHGSDSSSDEKFLEAVSPATAIISVGKNSFGHPSFRILKKLERAEAEILRTD